MVERHYIARHSGLDSIKAAAGGRPCMCARPTGVIQDRLESVLKQSGVQAITLYGLVDHRRREHWIEDRDYVDVLITYPRLVQT